MSLHATTATGLAKAPTGIARLDDIFAGGLPSGRPSLVYGGTGCGKTLFAITFLANGAAKFNEPGVFVSFAETAEQVASNVASFGYDLNGLAAEGKLLIDRVERHVTEEAGAYDLDRLFVRLGQAVDAIGARRVAIDSIDALFSGVSDPVILRGQRGRLLGWLKERGLTAILTARCGDGFLTPHGQEESDVDCVILLDNRVRQQIATRRLRVVKYRGSEHGSDEYPFLIDACGISVLPAVPSGLNHPVSDEIVASGIPSLDAMTRNGGFFRGSGLLLSGGAGTGKTLIGNHFIDAACERGERCMVFVFEESAAEICRNALSVGLDLQKWIDAGLLRFEAARPSLDGLEMHLARMNRDVETFQPAVAVVDSISAVQGRAFEVHSMRLRMVDLLKSKGISSLFISSGGGDEDAAGIGEGFSSLMDTWIKLSHVEANGERNRGLRIVKSRGTGHSNQVREYLITDQGIQLIDAYVGPENALTGTSRVIQETRDQAAADLRGHEIGRRRREIARRRAELERQIADLRACVELEEDEAQRLLLEEEGRAASWAHQLDVISARRGSAK